MLTNGANCNFLQYLVDWRIKQYRNENFLANSNVRLKCSAFITSFLDCLIFTRFTSRMP